MSKCCVCQVEIEKEEDAALLGMGVAGIPRYLCDDCDKLIETAILGKDYDEIGSAISRISHLMADGNPDGVTYDIMSVLMLRASDRAVAIKEGTYDFSLDEQPTELDGGLEEIPDELKETEEDREKDRIEEEKAKKFDKIYNYFLIGLGIAFVGFVIWKIIENFFLK